MHVTVTAVICFLLDLAPNVNNPSHWWDLEIGSVPLAKVVCYQSMTAAVVTETQLFHGINTNLIHSVNHPSLIVSGLLEPKKLNKIGITSKHLLKLSFCVAIKKLHFAVIGKVKIH